MNLHWWWFYLMWFVRYASQALTWISAEIHTWTMRILKRISKETGSAGSVNPCLIRAWLREDWLSSWTEESWATNFKTWNALSARWWRTLSFLATVSALASMYKLKAIRLQKNSRTPTYWTKWPTLRYLFRWWGTLVYTMAWAYSKRPLNNYSHSILELEFW